MTKPLLTLFGLKWNPFTSDVPIDGLYPSPITDQFCWRIQHALIRSGGFALITGDPGMGKSVTLRLLAHQLSQQPDLSTAVLTHPSSRLGDFYREMGDLFGINLTPSNRWGGFKSLREQWQDHLNSTLTRPVLLIDEAQELLPCVLNELRLLSSTEFDSKNLLSIVLAGDSRLTHKLNQPDLLPLASRIKVKLGLTTVNPAELKKCLVHVVEQAGNQHLLTESLIDTLAEHSMGNYRTLMSLSHELLMEAARKEYSMVDEKLYLDVFNVASKTA